MEEEALLGVNGGRLFMFDERLLLRVLFVVADEVCANEAPSSLKRGIVYLPVATKAGPKSLRAKHSLFGR